MTKSRGVGRGGKRRGAGRPKKPVAGPVTEPVVPLGLSADEAAKACSDFALQVLVTIAATGSSEAARVAAADKILDRAHGKPRPAAMKPGSPDDALPKDGWEGLLEAPGVRPN